MILSILRGVFILLVAAVAALYLLSNQSGANVSYGAFVIIMVTALALAAALVAFDASTRQKRLSALGGIFLGLIAGLVAAYALSFVVDLIGLLTAPSLPFDPPRTAQGLQALTTDQRALIEGREAYLNLLKGVKVFIGLITCYLGISLVIQTKDDFRFVIPYVEFAKQIRGNRPTVLDTSIIVDGRILDIVETRVMQGLVVVPKFVLNELQTIADSSDKLRRARGRRGLDILQKLQNNTIVDVMIDDREVEGMVVDHKLISLAQEIQGRVMTNDYNLNKVATLRGVEVINLNDLAKAMRPVVLPGEHMNVRIVKPGESPTQGVGYLEDGTMVVVEFGRDHIGEEIQLVVTSTLQTSAGRMIFGRYDPDGENQRQHQIAADDEHAAGSSQRQDAGEGAAGGSADKPATRPAAPQAGSGPAEGTGPQHRPGRASARNPRRSR